MKRKVLQPVLLNIIIIALFGWAVFPLYMAQIQFAEIMKNPEPPWEVTFQFTPVFIFFLICTPIAYYLYKRNKKKHKGFWRALMLPPELEEADEREQYVTAKACRTSYITMYITAPVATSLLLLYPLVQDSFSYYPVIVILLIPLSQMLAYFISLNKNM